ncbi:MAG: ATP-binding protein [Acidimicrobiia bacterium]|nr:ATP-binding protein [Acidimicrobiia bacterium]
MPGYLPRLADKEIGSALRRRGAVLVEGCRACGKTWAARNVARSEARLDDEATLLIAEADPVALLQGVTPRLLDEWQNAPRLWNRVRRECDDRARLGQFVLTGSAAPHDDITRHTGVGRIARVLMRPMSLYESGDSTGALSLGRLFEGEAISVLPSGAGLRDVASAVCVGGWPGSLALEEVDARLAVADYVSEVVRLDVPTASGVRHRPAAVRRLMRSLARHVATEAKTTTLVSDVGGGSVLARSTVNAYLEALERVFLVENQPAWSVGLRSRATLRRAPKRHFVDPSLAASMLRASPERLLADPRTFGLLFESLVVRDLRIYSQPDRGEVFHYRDDTGLEVDAVIERDDGRWIAVEVKLSSAPDVVDEAAKSLLRLRDKVARNRVENLAALMVVTSTGPAYRRSDNVQVTPITELGP